MRNDFFGEMAETGGVPLNASPVRRWAGVFGHRPFAFSISMGVKTSDGMNWNLQDLVYEALSEEWRKRNDEGNRQRLLDMLKAHAAELRAWASDAGVRLPSAESAGELREQVRDLPQEPQIQEQPGYGYQPGFQQPQQWQQQPWN